MPGYTSLGGSSARYFGRSADVLLVVTVFIMHNDIIIEALLCNIRLLHSYSPGFESWSLFYCDSLDSLVTGEPVDYWSPESRVNNCSLLVCLSLACLQLFLLSKVSS